MTRLTILSAVRRTGSIVREAGKRAMAGAVLSLTGCLAPLVTAMAAPIPWLYDVDVAVEGRDAAARTAVSGKALLEVLSRVSGLAHVPRNERVREALGRPESYYNRFVFLDDDALRIHFTPGAILRLMDEARLPVWSANRPRAMVWLVVERGGIRRIVDGEHPLAVTLSGRARQRGLVVNLPLMDLEDRMHVRPAVVRGRLFAPLDEASRRYGADVVLAGQVLERACVSGLRDGIDPKAAIGPEPAGDGPEIPHAEAEPSIGPDAGIEPQRLNTGAPDELTTAIPVSSATESYPAPEGPPADDTAPDRDPPGGPAALPGEVPRVCGPAAGVFYSGSIQAWMDGEEFATEFTVADIEAAGSMTVDFIADELAARFAVLAREPNAVSLTIRGIDTAVGYGRLLGYLGDLEFVTFVDVAAVEAGRLEITLHTRAGVEQLVELLESDGRIRPDPANASDLIWRGP